MQVLAHNLLSQFTNRQLSITSKEKGKSAEKLSSGYRINRSADDAAGLQISEKMRSQVRGLTQASRNIQDGISLCQVADGALNETHSILQRMRELSVQAANDTNQEVDRDAIQSEINELTKEVDRIANDTSFNHGIFPLRDGNLISNNISGDKSSNISDNTEFGFYIRPDLHISSSGYQNLSNYIYDANYIDFKIQLNYASNTLELHSLDSTLIFSGNCGEGFHPSEFTYGPKVHFNYYAYHKYSFTALLDTPSNYFSNGTFDFDFEMPEDMNITELNNFLNKSKFRFYIRKDYTLDFMAKFDDNSSINSSNNNGTNTNTDTCKNENLWIQTGANSMQGIFLNLVNATAKGIGITDPALDVTSYDNANTSISRLDNAINQVSAYRSQFGAQQNRLEYAKSVDDNTAENTQYAESRIRDADMAEEMVKYAKHNILEQAGQSMLTHANQSTQGILALLQ